MKKAKKTNSKDIMGLGERVTNLTRVSDEVKKLVKSDDPLVALSLINTLEKADAWKGYDLTPIKGYVMMELVKSDAGQELKKSYLGEQRPTSDVSFCDTLMNYFSKKE